MPPDLVVEPWPAEYADLATMVAAAVPRLTGWPPHLLDGLAALAAEAEERLAGVDRSCFVHSDFNLKNILVEPGDLTVTGVVDWEFAHSGSPYADVGNLLRFDRDPAFVAGVLSRWGDLELGRAADLPALLDLAVRHQDPASRHPVTAQADRLLRTLARLDASEPPA